MKKSISFGHHEVNMGKRKITILAFIGLALVMASALGFGGIWAAHKGFGNRTTGFITRYHEQPLGCAPQPFPPGPCPKHDLSGAATDGNVIIFADDGGSPSAYNFIRVVAGGLPDDALDVGLPLSLLHKDLEGATYWNPSGGPFFVVTTSLDTELDLTRRRLTRFKVNLTNTALTDQTSVDLRGNNAGTEANTLMKALKDNANFNSVDAGWFDRIKVRLGTSSGANAGGLNIEGLSTTDDPNENALLWGLRAPLFGTQYATISGAPSNDPDNLRKGVAIVAKVATPFGTPSFTFKTLNLNAGPYQNTGCPVSDPCFGNHGIRGMEWIPAMQGFVIIGGPVVKGDDYSLWFWNGLDGLDRVLERLDDGKSNITKQFRQLCRPESVIQIEEKGHPFLVIFSEHSGPECAKDPTDPTEPLPFNFIKARIVPAND